MKSVKYGNVASFFFAPFYRLFAKKIDLSDTSCCRNVSVYAQSAI